MTRIVTGQLDAYVEPGPRIVAEVPGMREEFERVGGRRGAQQLALRPRRRGADPRGGRGGGHRRLRRAARRPAAARLRRRVPDLVRRGGEPRAARAIIRELDAASTGSRLRAGPVSEPGCAGERSGASMFRACFRTSPSVQRSLADYTHLVGPRPDRGDPRARRAAGRASGSCTSARPRSAAASRRSSTRSSR